MKKRYINATLFLLIVLAVAFGGQYIGTHYMQSHDHKHHTDSVGWHKVLHDRLNITAEQDKQLVDIEKRYRQRRLYLEEQMRLANMELAEAIKADKSFSPNVQAATDKIHQAMGELQKATLEHLFEMRPILTDEQNQKLEQMVTDALYENK
ncbi:MAG: heavy metal resistance protein [Alphaproteobacteria bacterium CG11_big_fil_rev_8_21_14_0_20_44_7]|nr:MAG: heavy metal resistance protein [Alphaproteobacteria bacterium CG11_big_fil_rev_8_21_14_0_20_44_7]|tara:strand:- start:3681 stop:4133 length:453 start_codon:yes stop_codon:yes gene_type:complete